MTTWPSDPVIYELNTAAWLHDISQRTGVTATLADIPATEWNRVTPPGVDAVLLMGVWERGPAGVELAMESAEQVASFRAALPDFDETDVIGSAYCISRYEVDERLGGRAGLAAARAALAQRNVRLLVDFVPNHVAPDHRWLTEHPDYFVQSDTDELRDDPAAFIAVGDAVIARGRDPYFPPWPDVAQLNAFAPGLRQAAADTLSDIAEQADGVRCDMAMLLLNTVFARTWGDRAGAMPDDEYWTEMIGSVRETHPHFIFAAEAYWDLEWDLQQLGFDHCYDKRLYDRLLHEGPAAVRGHLQADLDFQRHLIRFLENHDELRAASELEPDRERAAAVAIATLPGATMWHEGQFEGWRVHVPVFLARRPAEPVDANLRQFHLGLLAATNGRRRGSWDLLDTSGWPGDSTNEQLLAWSWIDSDQRSLIVINDADGPAAARVHLRWDDLDAHTCHLTDLLTDQVFTRDGPEMAGADCTSNCHHGDSTSSHATGLPREVRCWRRGGRAGNDGGAGASQDRHGSRGSPNLPASREPVLPSTSPRPRRGARHPPKPPSPNCSGRMPASGSTCRSWLERIGTSALDPVTSARPVARRPDDINVVVMEFQSP